MNLDSNITFRVTDRTKSILSEMASNNNMKNSDLTRLAYLEGIKVVERVVSEKRQELTLAEALLLRSVNANYK